MHASSFLCDSCWIFWNRWCQPAVISSNITDASFSPSAGSMRCLWCAAITPFCTIAWRSAATIRTNCDRISSAKYSNWCWTRQTNRTTKISCTSCPAKPMTISSKASMKLSISLRIGINETTRILLNETWKPCLLMVVTYIVSFFHCWLFLYHKMKDVLGAGSFIAFPNILHDSLCTAASGGTNLHSIRSSYPKASQRTVVHRFHINASAVSKFKPRIFFFISGYR